MENNTIVVSLTGETRFTMNRETVEKLERFVPNGCPFEGYTLFDLLKDFIWAYSWKITSRKIGIAEFIRMLQKDGEIKAVTYGDAIINLI